MPAQKVIETQTALSEKLQLLHEMNYSDGVDMPYQFVGPRSNKPIRTLEDTQADIRALDLIAICLTTGRAGDVVAAAFDKSAGLRLILAKNELPTAQDIAATKVFLASLTSAADWAAVMPFILEHGKDNVIHRISQFHRSLSTFHPYLTKSSNNRKNPLDKGFPNSDSTREAFYGVEMPPFESMLEDLIKRCLDLSAPVASKSISIMNWTKLQVVFLSDVLRQSLILQEFTNDKNPAHCERKAYAERLKRRLDKICQYQRLNSLITKVKKWFPYGNIPFHWVGDKYDGSGEGHLEPDIDLVNVIARGRDNKDPSQPSPLQPGDIAEV